MDTQQRKQRSGSRQRPGAAPTRKNAAPARKSAAPAGEKNRTRRPPAPGEKRPRPQTEPRKKRPVSQRPPAPRENVRPEIVYTPPRPFSRNRFLLHLATVAAVVLAITFGMSIFFKVKTVTVSGAKLYTPWDVRQASGIAEGDSLLTLWQPKVAGKLRAALPYVESLRIGIKLPDTVNIEIVETEVVYAVQAQDNSWWLISSQGRVVEQVDNARAGDTTKLLGVKLVAPLANLQAQAAEENRPAEDGETAPPVTVTGADRLETALEIVRELENNGFLGDAASVDVSDLKSLVLWYGDQYEVRLGDNARLDYKLRCMREAVDQMSQYQSGILDVSFTVWPDKVGYTPLA